MTVFDNNGSGKLVVITGASSGIGAATARSFSERGYSLLLLARRLDRMKELALPNSLSLAVDVTDVDAVSRAIQQAEEQVCCLNQSLSSLDVKSLTNLCKWLQYGPVQVLVNKRRGDVAWEHGEAAHR